ncbi:MAG: hypothetical protein AAGK92_04605 [Pseudomonadota bacterium]
MQNIDLFNPSPVVRRRRSLAILAALLVAGQAFCEEAAFPGADGYGAFATGWKGGDVIRVTNLANEGSGSLRACAENDDKPRVCIFAVSGTVVVDRPIRPGSNLYIAGQTAPGSGIQIRVEGPSHGPIVFEDVHDVILRFLKLRPGPSTEPSPTVDAVTIEDSKRLYLGNLSMAFATDETFNIHVSNGIAADITLADSLLALSLDRANHPDGRHSKGALICSTEGTDFECGRISLLRNLFAHHRDRNPDVKATSIGPVEVINNVFFNPISQIGEVYDLAGDLFLIYAGNTALPGPSTNTDVPEALQAFDWTESAIEIAAWGNNAPARDNCRKGRSGGLLDPVAEAALVATSAETMAPVYTAETGFKHVMTHAGDAIPGRRQHDALDQFVIDSVFTCSGRVINAPSEVGGWPELPEAPPLEDRDGDGFPDAWEATHAILDPNRPDDVWALDATTGLSHLETWLATLAGDLPQNTLGSQ